MSARASCAALRGRARCLVVDEPLIVREELTGTLFAIADIREDVREIRDLLSEDDDGEDAEAAT